MVVFLLTVFHHQVVMSHFLYCGSFHAMFQFWIYILYYIFEVKDTHNLPEYAQCLVQIKYSVNACCMEELNY